MGTSSRYRAAVRLEPTWLQITYENTKTVPNHSVPPLSNFEMTLPVMAKSTGVFLDMDDEDESRKETFGVLFDSEIGLKSVCFFMLISCFRASL